MSIVSQEQEALMVHAARYAAELAYEASEQDVKASAHSIAIATVYEITRFTTDPSVKDARKTLGLSH